MAAPSPSYRRNKESGGSRRRLGEFELIARYFAPLSRGHPGAWGLLDDVATIAPSPGCELVVKTDAVVAGVHFFADDPPDLVARKALRVNLSDLAAKGARPLVYLLDLILPDSLGEAWVAGFARGLEADQAEYGIHLVGGDTDKTPGPATIAVMALGEIALGRTIRRGGARPGDLIFVTGTIGDAALWLLSLRGGLPDLSPGAAGFLGERYRLPRPRVALGQRLVGIATAGLDVSDGLVADLRHLCEVCGLAAEIEASRVPLSAAAREAIGARPELLAAALSGGDDYEILFTAPKSAAANLARLAAETGVPITAIGKMVAAPQPTVTVRDERGRTLPLAAEGWTHF